MEIAEDLKNNELSVDDALNLKEILNILNRRKKILILVTISVFSISLIYTVYKRIYSPIYKGVFSILVEDPINSSNNNKFQGSQNPLSNSLETFALGRGVSDVPTLIVLLKSPNLLRPVSERFNIQPEKLQKMIVIKQGGGKTWDTKAKGILNISLTGKKPIMSKALIDSLSDHYIKSALLERQKKLSDGLSFLNKQAPNLVKKTSDLQSKLASFRIKYELIEPNLDGLELKKTRDILRNQIFVLNSKISSNKKIIEQLNNGFLKGSQINTILYGLSRENENKGDEFNFENSPILIRIEELKNELNDAKLKFTENSKIVRTLETKINKLEPILIDYQIEALEQANSLYSNKINILIDRKNKIDNIFLKKPELIKDYEDLKQKLIIAQNNLSGLNATREKFQLEFAQENLPWKITTPPRLLPKPISPVIPRNLLAGLFLGFMSGAVLALIREKLDNVFHNSEEVIRTLGIPLLGHIPFINSNEINEEDSEINIDSFSNEVFTDKETGLKNRFFFQESLRSLATSLRFLNTDEPIKSFCLTSSLSSEGKSCSSIFLCKTLSELGKKVLLIDSDMRLPTLHKRLNLKNVIGFSNLLSDSTVDLSSVIQSVPNHKNWDFLPCGGIPPDPVRLLSSKRVPSIIQDLKSWRNYDYLIFDTVPLSGLTDSLLLGQHCDGMVLLVSLENVEKEYPKQLIKKINFSGNNILGVITNNKKFVKKSSNSYGYYSDYNYSYGKYGRYSENKSKPISTEKDEDLTLINMLKKKTSSQIRVFLEWLDN